MSPTDTPRVYHQVKHQNGGTTMGKGSSQGVEKHAGTAVFFEMMTRMPKAYARRAWAGQADVDALAQIVEIQRILDEQLHEVVHALRSEQGGAHSWAEIGNALGITRAAAANRFGKADTDARRPGGQPDYHR